MNQNLKQSKLKAAKIILCYLSVLSSLATATAYATTWDVQNEFSTTNNPNGVYSYGWKPGLTGGFKLYDAIKPALYCEDIAVTWYNTNTPAMDFIPIIGRNITTDQTCAKIQPGEVVLHPGRNGEFSTLHWTSPINGNVNIKGHFGAGDVGVMSYFIRKNDSIDLYTKHYTYSNGSFDINTGVSVGTTIDFLVGEGMISGSTPLHAIITSTAEWSTLFTSIKDIDNDTYPELVVVTYDPALKKSTATIKNASSGVLIKQIDFNGEFAPQKIRAISDRNGNATPELAVLGVRSSDNAVQVEIRDSLSGLKLNSVSFPATWKPIDLGIVPNINKSGGVGLAVLEQNATGLQVQIKNAMTDTLIRTISFSSDYNGVDLVVIPDVNGNKSHEIAVLADNKALNSADKVEIHDSKTGALIHNISYGIGQKVQQLLSIADLNNNSGSELAVLRTNTARVQVKDSKTGLAVNTLDYALTSPFKLAPVDDGKTKNVALLGLRASDSQIRAQVHDVLTDTTLNNVVYDQYGTSIGFISIPDINSNDYSELVRLREQPGPQKYFAEVRDGKTGDMIQGIYF